jgi:hypothetical protein
MAAKTAIITTKINRGTLGFDNETPIWWGTLS